MRRYIKKKFLVQINNVNKIMEQVEIALLQKISVDYETVFAQLQDELISIGTDIENIEGKDCRCVCILEDVCEMLYQFLINEETSLRFSIIKNIKNKLKSLINELENNVSNDKNLVVFLPYKASMWDSLESIWFAAMNDKNCETYVIPIPYYDKNSDGSHSKMHYEGNEYPYYVPIINWEQVNLKELHPDIIYFHNPYDNTNKITSVHFSFYSKELRCCTEKLVYVPYFVATNDKVQEHLCVNPGTIFSDFIIVQSEKIKDVYVQELIKAIGDIDNTDLILKFKNKTLALGSPKIDKSINALKENYTISEDWRNKLYNKKGKRKTIILLNTTLLYLLEYKEQYLATLNKVFNFFKDNEDILLWWRPHPLSEAMFDSMKSELKNTYLELVNLYLENEIGIYDDSSNLHRAVSMCDACYGDNSSVLALVWAQNKPIMLRNVRKFYNILDFTDNNFKYAFRENKYGIKKTLLFENKNYCIHNFINDIFDINKKNNILKHIELINNSIKDEVFLNMGYAGEIIHQEIKKY